MTVELLWWEGCPSYPETLADLERALAAVGVDSQVQMVEIESGEQARRERFPGSPTIRIDGEDVVPSGQDERWSLTCRIYRRRDGTISPQPDSADVRAALRAAMAVRARR
jgi:hypothetical protein